MNREEFSNGFSTMLNSYATAALHGDEASRAEIVLDEWEKSFFLTKAQDKVVLSFYGGNNTRGESFETSEEMRRYLAPLVCESSPMEGEYTLEEEGTENEKKVYKTKSKFTLPKDLWFIIYETMDGSSIEGDGCDAYYSNIEVYPVTHDEYNKIKNNPFRGPSEKRALRLDLGDHKVEIICKKPVRGYSIRYIRKPKPILLEDFPNDLALGGVTKSVEPVCELHEALHQTILDEAVKLAYVSKSMGKSTEKDTK